MEEKAFEELSIKKRRQNMKETLSKHTRCLFIHVVIENKYYITEHTSAFKMML